MSKHIASHPHAESPSTVLPRCREVQDVPGCTVATVWVCLPKVGEFFVMIVLKEKEL